MHATVRPIALFDHLLRRRELISYRAACRIAFGPLLGRWRGYGSAKEVIRWARATRRRTVAELQIGLGALIVVDSTERPAARLRRSGYGKTQHGWAERFDGWTLGNHKPGKTVRPGESVLGSR